MAELCSVSLSIWRGRLQNIIGDAAGTEEAAAKKKAEAAKKEATTKGKAKKETGPRKLTKPTCADWCFSPE